MHLGKIETLHTFLANTARYLKETFFILARIVWGSNRPNCVKFCQLFLHESVVFMLFSTHFAVSSPNCRHRRVFLFLGFFRYASNTQIKFFLWYGYWSYDPNETCLTKIESQNLILCVFIEFKVFSVKSFFSLSTRQTFKLVFHTNVCC